MLSHELYQLPSYDHLMELNQRVGSMLWNLKASLRKRSERDPLLIPRYPLPATRRKPRPPVTRYPPPATR